MPASDSAALYRQMVSDLQTPKKSLTTWEAQFVESVSDQLTNKGYLSSRQIEILTSLHEEKA